MAEGGEEPSRIMMRRFLLRGTTSGGIEWSKPSAAAVSF